MNNQRPTYVWLNTGIRPVPLLTFENLNLEVTEMKLRLHSAQETKTIEGTVEEIKDYLRAINQLPFIDIKSLKKPYSEKFHGLTVTFSLASKNSKQHIIAAQELKRIKEEEKRIKEEQERAEEEMRKQEAIQEAQLNIKAALRDELSRVQLGKVVKFGESTFFEVKYEVENVSFEDLIQVVKSQDLAVRIETISVKSQAETEASISDYYGRSYDTWTTSVDTELEIETVIYEGIF